MPSFIWLVVPGLDTLRLINEPLTIVLARQSTGMYLGPSERGILESFRRRKTSPSELFQWLIEQCSKIA